MAENAWIAKEAMQVLVAGGHVLVSGDGRFAIVGDFSGEMLRKGGDM